VRVIHQAVAAFVGGDAIGNFAQQIQRGLQTLGFESGLYAASVEPSKRGQALRMGNHLRDAPRDGGLIYHHSIGSPLTEYVAQWPGPRLMIYHNITPGYFLRAHNPRFADLVDAGRRALPAMAGLFSLGVGVSEFNRRDLVDAGFERTAVLPIPIDVSMVRRAPRRDVWPKDRKPRGIRLLFVGRMMPHKRPDLLVEWFAEQIVPADPAARLVLVGGLDDRFRRFNEELIHTVRACGGRVRLAGRVGDDELIAWYRWADGFVSFSEHEGFMVPLLEAMATDTVVFARKTPAVAETLGGAGVIFDDAGPEMVGGLVREVLGDEDARRAVLVRQAARLKDFSPRRFLARLAGLLETWLESGK
jgi:glycosyltransferase involved in cell wall biosynthesis